MPIDMTDSPIPKGPTRKTLKGKQQYAEEKQKRLTIAAVRERAQGICERCCRFAGVNGEMHHKVKRSQGGTWTVENIIFLCRFCHGNEHGQRR